MDLIEALRLQVEWGADEALLDAVQDRRAAQAAPVAVTVQAAAPAKRVHTLRPAAALPGGAAQAEMLAEGCESLEALEKAIAGFSGCALRDTATQLVFADGAADARLVVVGEAPGAEEDRAGRPFVGPAGQLLDKMLGSIGLDRSKVRIINTVLWRPPGDRSPTDAEVAVCLPFLLRHIALVRPRGLLLLGAVAAKAVLPEPERGQGIRRLRGVWRQVKIPGLAEAMPCLPSYHPAYLLRMPSAKAEAWRDLLQLREFLESKPE
ncbi:DNA polymerase [Acidocella aquatica]|uniref:Type-4 uracil-DNA glycosylase n=1 Tax=Acidocella aquatica TaxID=1922313 RepID=A0ABQ6AB53_9PROT|nr:uracil-DNA glycosylase [Acidocella aquatica]GLR68532.1 DNA polymerase [Acidocella aquatica]